MIVVTGGLGFVGQHLVDVLSRRLPDRRVRILDVRRPDDPLPPKVHAKIGSILDPEDVETAVKGAEAVVHLAAKVQPESSNADQLRQINVEGTRNVYHAAVAAECGLFVHVSSRGVYGPPSREGAFRETDAVDPRTPYQRTKWMAEQVIENEPSENTVVNIVRPAGLYGPGSYLELPRYRKILRQRYVLELRGGGDSPPYVRHRPGGGDCCPPGAPGTEWNDI